MNFVVIISDTYRRDHLGCYGNKWISTPNLDKFAAESLVFDKFYTGSFPTVPQRRDLLTGRYSFTYSDWGPLPHTEVTLAQALGESGYMSYMVFDTPHLNNNGFWFDRGFSAWNWIRGQEDDRLRPDPRVPDAPFDVTRLRDVQELYVQHLRNNSDRRCEEDYFAPRTMREAMRWLERNYKTEKFLLYVDTFDPHEPWDPPKYYTEMYDPGYEGDEIHYPLYGPIDYLTPAELKHIRAMYAGEVTMVDRWVGRLLQKIEDLGLADDTVVIFTTDHGYYFGEHGIIGKVTMMYEEVCHVPFMIRVPGRKPGRTDYYAQAVDVMPTLLDLAGAPQTGTCHGKSLMGLLNGEESAGRGYAVSSWSIAHKPTSDTVQSMNPYNWAELSWALKPSTFTTDEYVLISGASDIYPELYHLPSDPRQERNLYAERTEEALKLHKRYIDFLEQVNTPAEYIDYRRVLPKP